MVFHALYSLIEGLWKRKQKDEFLENHLNLNEKEQYQRLNKIIKILIYINLPLIMVAGLYNFYFWIPPFFAMFLSTIRQAYRRYKLHKYGFLNYNKWYLIIYYLLKWIFVILFFIYGSYRTILFILIII